MPTNNDAIGRQIGEMDIRSEEHLMAGQVSREDLIMLHKELCEEALELMKRKNSDYAFGDDPFANFRMFGDKHALLGIVFRLGDKLRRLFKASLGEQLEVSEESARDILLDIINYAVIWHGVKITFKKVLDKVT